MGWLNSPIKNLQKEKKKKEPIERKWRKTKGKNNYTGFFWRYLLGRDTWKNGLEQRKKVGVIWFSHEAATIVFPTDLLLGVLSAFAVKDLKISHDNSVCLQHSLQWKLQCASAPTPGACSPEASATFTTEVTNSHSNYTHPGERDTAAQSPPLLEGSAVPPHWEHGCQLPTTIAMLQIPRPQLHCVCSAPDPGSAGDLHKTVFHTWLCS